MQENTLVVRNVELTYLYLGQPNTDPTYGSGKYEVTVFLNKEQAQAVRGFDLSPKQKIKETEDGRYRITLKSARPPMVANTDGIRMTPDELMRVGRGSTANVRIKFFQTKGATYAGIGAIKFKNILEYNPDAFADLDDEDSTVDSVASLDDDDDL